MHDKIQGDNDNSSHSTLQLTEDPSHPRQGQQFIRGMVTHIIFHSPESGYTVFQLENENEHMVTVVGHFLDLQEGEHLQIYGDWVDNTQYGRQFKATTYERSNPNTLKGMELYLSNVIKGIGPKLAKQIVDYFGFQTIRIIEEDPERLTEVAGIGRAKLRNILDSWDQQVALKEVMIFLQGYGIPLSQTKKIYNRYGSQTIHILRKNPYRLATDIKGIGFKKADLIAQSMGIEHDDPRRAKAAILYFLQKKSDHGHVYYPKSLLLQEIPEELNIPLEILIPSLEELSSSSEHPDQLITEPLPNEDTALFLPALVASERGSAGKLKRLLDNPLLSSNKDFDALLEKFQRKMKIQFEASQRKAIMMAIDTPVSIITGGPGTGKTTIVRAVCHLLEHQKKKFLLAAPTGRAAKRLKESTGWQAKTIHRLLEFDPSIWAFTRNEDYPLDADFIIIDEASMIDIYLFYSLLRAIPLRTQLLLVGDSDQLPSVGPGNVLHDLIKSSIIPITRLDRIFRQEEKGLIVQNAHRVNKGLLPILPPNDKTQLFDFYFIKQTQPQQIVDIILELVKKRIPERFSFSIRDIQIISPMYKSETGIDAFNKLLQKEFTLDENNALSFGERRFCIGDKVIQTRNDYEKNVFNGDIGWIETITPHKNRDKQQAMIIFDDQAVIYKGNDFDSLQLAYAISVHKSQGSEYPVVILPITTQHFLMLQRNLLYTAITRGKELVILVGDPKALFIAIRNNKIKARYSRLAWRLNPNIESSSL